jgi:transposase
MKLAKTLTKYRDGVLKAVRLGFSNSLSEALNAKIRVLTHRAYGFHSVVALMAMVYLCCGDISLRLPI